MLKDYLASKGFRISLNQSDHNACPTCKTLHYAILEYGYEVKMMRDKLQLLLQLSRPLSQQQYEQMSHEAPQLIRDISNKTYQKREPLKTLQLHNDRDGRIRKTLKEFTDFFRSFQRNQEMISDITSSFEWLQCPDRAILTHRDDMTKVDLPCFIVNASADITRWRFDVNAHVVAITDESISFSHEQGTGPKNGSSVLELILLDHLLRCKGEAIKVIVSDYTSVGKNWLNVVSLPQYFADQGLAAIVLVVFLEKNHGKYLADMLLGQLQSRRRRTTIL